MERQIIFEIVPNPSIPKGVAVVVHQDRVLWIGPANMLNPDAANAWPEGAVMNLAPVDHDALKGKLPKNEGRPR